MNYTLSLSPDSAGPITVTLTVAGKEPQTYVLKPGEELRPIFREKRR